MGEKSAIGWTDATHNFWYGCQKVSPGCKFCYAEREMTRYGKDFRTITRAKGFDRPLRWKEPRMIFVNSWSDFFIKEADNWRDDAWDIIRQTPHHTYQILTKRPERIPDSLPADWGDGWPNVWLGTSIENQDYMYRAVLLLKVQAPVLFISAEPLLGPLTFGELVDRLDWLVMGGESGPKARPMQIEWARDSRDQWKAKGKPVFFKQQSGPRPGMNSFIIEEDGSKTEWKEWPK